MTGASVEDRIVAMKIENTQFEKGVAQSLSSLQKLESALNKGFSGKGLADVQNSVGRFNLNPMEAAISGISRSWLAMSTVAVTALATVTNSVLTTGASMVKSLSLDPVLQGFGEYSTNLNSIQTVLANTEAQGTTLDDVNGALQNLNKYSDKTIYNFGEMAKNIGTFTAAGVSLDDSVDSIKGIANLAALSGSSSEQASTAMYQLSQAIAAGRVSLQDWNSVVNAGMGGATFQRALAQTASAMGTIDEAAINIDKTTGKMTINGESFRDSISAIGGEKWLTSDVLTNTLSQFTGDLTDAQLAAQGFNKEQIAAIQRTAATAQDAATKVKTISQVFDVAKETIGSGWSLTFMRIFGDFEQARTTFTSLSNTINGFITTNSKARNRVLKDWGELGGRTKLISAVTNAWKALMSVLGPIHDAFREIFPAKTGEQLFQLSKGLNQFFRALRLTKDAQEDLKNTFAGFFAVLHIGFTIISGVAHLVGTLLGLLIRGQGSTLAFTGGIGKMLVALDAFLTKGKFVENFFNLLTNLLVGILSPLLDIRSALIGAFSALVTGDPSGFFDGIAKSIQILLGFVDSLSASFANVVNSISDAMGGLGHISGFSLASMFGGADTSGAADGINKVKDSIAGLEGPSLHIKEIWDSISNAFHAVGDFMRPLTSQFAAAFAALKEQFSNLFSGKELDFSEFLSVINTGLFLGIFLTFRRFSNSLAGIGEAAQGVLKQVTSNLKTMQADVRSDIIVKIAVSLLLLAGAIFLLAQTDPQSLGIALAAVSAMLIELVVAMKTLEKSVGGLKDAGKLPLMAAGILILSVAIAAMAGAVYLFSRMDMGQMQKGLLGVTESLAVLTAAAVLMSKSGAGANMIGAATGLLIMSAALVALSGAIMLYSRIDPETLTNGLVKVAATIAVLALSMNLMKTSVGGAVAMLIVSESLVILAKALAAIGAISKGDIFKALVTIGVALAIIATGMHFMETALPGALALIIIAEALLVMGSAIAVFGQMDIGTVVKGLLIVIGAIAALAGVAFLIAPVVPVMFALAASLALIGAAVFLAGAGVAAFAIGLALLANNGAKGFAVFKQIVMDFVDWLPQVILGLGSTIDAMVTLIGAKAPELVIAFTILLSTMLDAGMKLMPKFGKFISKMIETGLKVIVSYYSDLANAGLQLIENLLQALSDHVGDIADVATELAIHFVQAMARNAVKFANAALQALIDFLNGLSNAIDSHQAELQAAGTRVALSITNAILAPIRSLGGAILSALNDAWNAAKSGFHPSISIGGHHIIGRTNVDLVGQMVDKLGLVGGTDQVKNAFDAITDQINNEISKAKDTISKAEDQLKKLKEKGKGDSKEANKLRDQIKDQTKALKELKKEDKDWAKHQKENKATLLAQSHVWDANAASIKDATDALTKATDAQTSFQEGVKSQFGAKPDISKGQSLASYMRQVKQKTLETQKFMTTLQALRAQNLSDESYRQLLAEGTDAQRLMDQLLTGGGEAITAFNQANSNLTSAAATLASTASVSLFYDAAVSEAQGHLKGWQDSQAALEEQMNIIARAMVKALNKALKIKSPSRVFAESGKYSTEGVAMGMEAGIGALEKSAEKVALASLNALKDTMSKGSSILDIDLSPVITPVLDLTQMTKDVSQIDDMLAKSYEAGQVSYLQASSIAAARQAASETQTASAEGGTTEVTYNQYNTSPKALDTATIYRQSNSLLALKKEDLGV